MHMLETFAQCVRDKCIQSGFLSPFFRASQLMTSEESYICVDIHLTVGKWAKIMPDATVETTQNPRKKSLRMYGNQSWFKWLQFNKFRKLGNNLVILRIAYTIKRSCHSCMTYLELLIEKKNNLMWYLFQQYDRNKLFKNFLYRVNRTPTGKYGTFLSNFKEISYFLIPQYLYIIWNFLNILIYWHCW